VPEDVFFEILDLDKIFDYLLLKEIIMKKNNYGDIDD